MSRHNDPNQDPKQPELSDDFTESIEEFADALDRSVRAASQQLPGASALDPKLWGRIQQDGRATPRRSMRQPQTSSGTATSTNTTTPANRDSPTDPLIHLRTSERPSIPAAKWHRGLAGFLVVALVTCVVVFLPERIDGPQNGSITLNAPTFATPSPIDTENCRVEPLTTEEVYTIVVDVSLTDRQSSRSLFVTPPPADGDYAHTHTWLPDADGTVQLLDSTVDVSHPIPVEFQNVEASLNRYLRCQEEGTNFQLWALESKVEVQRQILQPLVRDLKGNEEVTEPMIVNEIERLGPLPRQGEQYLAFSTNLPPSVPNPLEGLKLEANPSQSDSFIFRGGPETANPHAWIGSQLVDEESDEAVLHRGAASDEPVPVGEDGSAVPMVGVFILIQDEETGAWLVEWFIPAV